ncbi:MAG: AAC(3) family N-acetyltransferase [Pseudomonadota bacterium]
MTLLRRIKTGVRPIVMGLPDRIQQRRRVREIEASRKAQSSQSLTAELDRLPISTGAAVLVHSSLKALGYVEGGPGTVVEALIEAVCERRGGTLMLPTFSIDGTMHRTLISGRMFDQRSTPSNLGAIPEAFRRHPGIQRSLHPTHSFAALGPKAEALTKDHHRAGSSFGDDTPMAKLLAGNGYLLGLGTDLGRVTFYHCLEEIEETFPIDVFTADSPITATCRDHVGQTHHLSIQAHDSNADSRRIDQPQNQYLRTFFQERFEQACGLTWHQVGEASAWLVEAQQLYAEIKRLMQAGVTIYSSPSELEAYQRRGGHGT